MESTPIKTMWGRDHQRRNKKNWCPKLPTFTVSDWPVFVSFCLIHWPITPSGKCRYHEMAKQLNLIDFKHPKTKKRIKSPHPPPNSFFFYLLRPVFNVVEI